MAQSLAQQYVQFLAKGVDAVMAGIQAITGGMQNLEKNIARVAAKPEDVAKAITRMRDDVESARVKLEALRQVVASGEYGKMAAETARITQEMQRLQKAADWQALLAQKGAIGAWADYIKGRVGELTGAIGGALNNAFQKTNQTIMATPTAIGAAVAGFQLLVNATRSWVNAGLQGTAEAGALYAQMTLLSRHIAGIFVPTLQQVTKLVREASEWFRHLTGDQQTNIRQWVEGAAAALLVFKAINVVKGGLISLATTLTGPLISAFSALSSVVTAESLTMGTAINAAFAGIPALIGLLVSAATAAATFGTAFVVGTQAGRDAMKGLYDLVKPLWEQLKSIGATLWTVIEPALEAIGASFGKLLSDLQVSGQQLVAGFSDVLPTIKDVIGSVTAVIRWVIDLTTATVRWANELGLIRGVVNLLSTGIFRIFSSDVVRSFLASLEAIFKVIVAIGGAVLNALGSVLGKVFGDGTLSIDNFNAALEAFAHWLSVAIPNAINKTIQALASLIDNLATVGRAFDFLYNHPWNAANLLTGPTNIGERLAALAREIAGIHVEVGSESAARRREGRAATHVTPVGGAFEDATALFRRLTESAIKQGAETERRERERRIEEDGHASRIALEAIKRKLVDGSAEPSGSGTWPVAERPGVGTTLGIGVYGAVSGASAGVRAALSIFGFGTGG